MARQCAWCLRLMNSKNECVSALPAPKMYQATHGMCQACSAFWLEQGEGAQNSTALPISRPEALHKHSIARHEMLY